MPPRPSARPFLTTEPHRVARRRAFSPKTAIAKAAQLYLEVDADDPRFVSFGGDAFENADAEAACPISVTTNVRSAVVTPIATLEAFTICFSNSNETTFPARRTEKVNTYSRNEATNTTRPRGETRRVSFEFELLCTLIIHVSIPIVVMLCNSRFHTRSERMSNPSLQATNAPTAITKQHTPIQNLTNLITIFLLA